GWLLSYREIYGRESTRQRLLIKTREVGWRTRRGAPGAGEVMAKRNARIHKPQVAITAGKRNKLITFGVLISLILAGIMFAQGESFLATQKQPNSRRAGTGPAILTSFEATSPSKEYIYAGGKLVATEDCPVTLDKSSQSFASS